jgi:hypothetical protein
MPIDLATGFLARVSQLCTEQAADLQALMQGVMGVPAPPDSVADLDHKELLASPRTTARQQLWQQIAAAQMCLAVHVIDHARALGTLLADPQSQVPVYAHAGLARSAVESAALLLHLLCAGQPFSVRLTRGVALLITDAGESVKAANRVPGNAYMRRPGPAVEAEHDRLLATVDRALVARVANRTGTVTKGVRISGGREEPVIVRASDLVENSFGDLPGIYNLLSGVVHGLPWRLADSTSVVGRDMRWEPDPVDIGGSVLAAVTAAHRAGAGFASYRGFPGDPRVGALDERTSRVDKALATFSKKWGVLDGHRPTIERLLQS